MTYVGALLVGTVATQGSMKVVDRLFGVVTGAAAVVYVVALLTVFVVVTAWAFSVFAVPEANRARQRARGPLP